MRISVLSLCIVVSLFSVSAVFAQNENLPGYANERFYPDPVTKKQQEDTSVLFKICNTLLGGFGLFECEGLRSHQVISPESLQASEEEINNPQARGISTEDQAKVLAKLEKDLDTATSSAQVLGIADALNWIFGGNQQGRGFIDSYRPANTTICDSANAQECTRKLAVALMPASMQGNATVPLPENPTADPNNPTDPNNPLPENPEPSIAPNPAPIGSGGFDLIEGFRKACIYMGTAGRVTEFNVDCLYNVSPRLGFGVIPELRNSALAYTNLQCVGFVRGMNLQFKGKALDNGGNAIDFKSNVPTGYRFINKVTLTGINPKVGDLLLWNTSIGPYGHIAYISVVYDKDRVGVLEANWGTSGMIEFRNVNVRANDILGWVTQG